MPSSINDVCRNVAMVSCPMLGSDEGIEPICYARNVVIGGTLIFQPATCFIHIVAIFMTAIMLYHIRTKYTAIGRKEITLFFYLYGVCELIALFLDSSIIPTYHEAYPWFTAIYMGLTTAMFWCLLVNGFIGFQVVEDGTALSVWSLRVSSFVLGALSFFVHIATFKSVPGFDRSNPIAISVFTFILHIICVGIYVITQLILVIRTLDDRWPITNIVFGVGFFVIGTVVTFGFSVKVCNAVDHYIDGLFFETLCYLLSVMMVYKYYDAITREDLEFSVGSKGTVWEVKDTNAVQDTQQSDTKYPPTTNN
ncbi:hypothetical protein E3P92_01589 [Wallemia ichthyophaga]|uniref:Chitin synthase export chaperone n=2 Tax=Wallemia ichthyophaga TaxID=245174 RepID=A0A4T0EHQ2_WALIC|nr:Chitin synthase export chaperone [Wallemia ichthyophaga EXF-994]TIA73436.1 hypothetical protein E3P91_01426 [Wallemia ichthyophaga]EOR00099.1 Chitin synthase export chaperone [Wallemia ichthyophaga EXF-994]TIA78064.1 hypothetical protein E3P98_04003 [Wallemia ichthyophaga]TIA91657.1 hypothetical protein E3P97_01924 [Wallemia ichthyophaga]TIA94881.1 hypothetical protein E3P95_04013 [Wallemia ichthyophaga]